MKWVIYIYKQGKTFYLESVGKGTGVVTWNTNIKQAKTFAYYDVARRFSKKKVPGRTCSLKAWAR